MEACKVNVKKPLRWSLAPLVLGMCVCLLWPAQSLARAVVRFIHGVPGVRTATVEVNSGAGNVAVGSIRFAQTTQWRSMRSGSFRWALVGGGKTLARGTASVGDGVYDIVVLDKASGVTLGIYKASGGKSGTSLVRVIHAAPELGSPQLMLDSKPAVKSLSFTQATPYLSVNPGTHTIGAMRPGDSTPLVEGALVSLVPGRAYSAIVLGSQGQRVRVVTLTDSGAPLTRKASARAPVKRSAAGPRSVVVRPGDSLWSIAKELLPADASASAIDHKVVQIWDRNHHRIGTNDPSLIFTGQRLFLS